MKVNSFQDRENVNQCQVLAKHDQVLAKHGQVLANYCQILAKAKQAKHFNSLDLISHLEITRIAQFLAIKNKF